MSPSISLFAGDSAFSWPIFARFSRLLEVAIRADHEGLRLLQHPHDEAVALGTLAAQFGRLVDRRVYLAPDLFLRGLQRFDHVLVADIRGHDEKIHIARRRISLLRYGAIDEGRLNALRQWCEMLSNDVGHAESLDHDSMQLFEDRCGLVRLVVALIALRAHRHQAGLLEPLELSLQRTFARLGELQELIAVERALRKAKQHGQHALLHAAEQGIAELDLRPHIG